MGSGPPGSHRELRGVTRTRSCFQHEVESGLSVIPSRQLAVDPSGPQGEVASAWP